MNQQNEPFIRKQECLRKSTWQTNSATLDQKYTVRSVHVWFEMQLRIGSNVQIVVLTSVSMHLKATYSNKQGMRFAPCGRILSFCLNTYVQIWRIITPVSLIVIREDIKEDNIYVYIRKDGVFRIRLKCGTGVNRQS